MQLRINRYLRLVASHFREAQCISVSGPDGTKVGTDLHINMGGMLNADTGRAAVGVPQVAPHACYSAGDCGETLAGLTLLI